METQLLAQLNGPHLMVAARELHQDRQRFFDGASFRGLMSHLFSFFVLRSWFSVCNQERGAKH
jgi:hypothetical protein